MAVKVIDVLSSLWNHGTKGADSSGSSMGLVFGSSHSCDWVVGSGNVVLASKGCKTTYVATQDCICEDNQNGVEGAPKTFGIGTRRFDRRPRTKDQGTQKDYVPAFERVLPQPPPRVETFAGPYLHVPGTEIVHVHPDCWGIRNTARAQPLRLCRCCVENGGRSLYDR